MSQATRTSIPATARTDELVAYLLGLGDHAYRVAAPYAEEYRRLHQVIRALMCVPEGERESLILRHGAQIAQVDRVLAALLVEGARERLASPDGEWSHLAEGTFFRVAREHGRLTDYLCFSGHFATPASSDQSDPLTRYFLFGEYFLSLPEGPTRQGLRLAVLSLFDRGADDAAVALAVCDRLRSHDRGIEQLAATRVLRAFERDEVACCDGASHDLDVQLVATAGRWRIAGALPHLRRLLDRTPPRDRPARVLRAIILRAIEQLS